MPKRAVTVELDPIEPGGGGVDDYSGALVSDLDFAEFSHSALVRIADEVCLQMHLLNLSFGIAVAKRAGSTTEAAEICTKQLTGIAGLAAERRLDHAARPRAGRAAPGCRTRGRCVPRRGGRRN